MNPDPIRNRFWKITLGTHLYCASTTPRNDYPGSNKRKLAWQLITVEIKTPLSQNHTFTEQRDTNGGQNYKLTLRASVLHKGP